MAVLPMQWVSIYALKRDRKALLELLQRLGVMEIETADVPADGFSRTDKEEEAAEFDRLAAAARRALSIVGEVVPVKGGMLSSLAGRRQVALPDYEAFAGRSAAVSKECLRAATLAKRREDCAAQRIRIRAAMEQLAPWKELDLPFGYTGTRTTAVTIGSLPVRTDRQALLIRLQGEEALPVEVELVGEPGEQTCLVAACPREFAEMMEERLRSMGFARPPALGGETTASRPPAEDLRALEKRLEELEQEEASIKEAIAALADKRQDMETAVDYYTARAEKYRAISRLDQSRHTVAVTGYVPAPAVPGLRETVEGRFTAVVETADTDPDTAPVCLKNGRFAGPAESITEMYALPGPGDIDPTPVMSFFYYLFFGMMLSDAGYGLLLILGAWFLIRKLRPEPAMERNLRLFMYCGVSTTLWGLVFGSFFGDAPEVIARTYFHSDFAMPRLMDPIDDAVGLLALSLGLGLVQILTGLGCRFYMQWRAGDRWGALFDTGFWMTALLGAAMLAVGMVAVPVLTTVGAVVGIASLLGLVLTQGRKKKGPMKVISGVASLYDVTGYVSDLMSYSRLMALGLTTGVMGSVFNMLGSMFGTAAMVVIFIIGHAVNFGINALGAYVHTIRLQYVELFSKFYEGGGRPFRPFALHSHYIRVKEETKS